MTPQRSVITIGNFDGVHAGHRAIIDRAIDAARGDASRVMALTFDPHPAAILRPGTQPPRLMSRDQKTAALRGAGVARVVIIEPTTALLSLSAEDFIRRVVKEHAPAAFVEGPDFRFGKDRAGDNATLATLGQTMGFDTHVVGRVSLPLHDQLLAPVSSSIIRWLLEQGRVADAARCMRSPLTLDAKIIKGDQRGRTLGTPTANLDPAALDGRVIPADGVYAATAITPGGRFPAAVSIGIKPTFKSAQPHRTIEAHLLDFTGDLYGQTLALQFHRWVRDQTPFPSLNALKAQIARDIAQIRRWHSLGLLTDLADNTPAVTA